MEYAADRYSCHLGYGQLLKKGLYKIYIDNSSSFNPHWFVSFMRNRYAVCSGTDGLVILLFLNAATRLMIMKRRIINESMKIEFCLERQHKNKGWITRLEDHGAFWSNWIREWSNFSSIGDFDRPFLGSRVCNGISDLRAPISWDLMWDRRMWRGKYVL